MIGTEISAARVEPAARERHRPPGARGWGLAAARVSTVTESHEHATQGSLAASGERLVPELQHGELVHAEHLARYRIAAQLADGRRVLDAASGEGYGSAVLSAAGAARVTGVDLNPDAVEHARERYGLNFEVADVAALPHQDDSFDLVVSFETIEHVADPAAALSELRRVLAEDGTLLISTPNSHEYLVENEFHTREFTHEEFVGMLSDLFPSVEVLLQHNWLTSAISAADIAADGTGEHRHEVDLYRLAGIAAGGELYTVAICGSAAQHATRSVAVLAAVDEAHRIASRLTQAEATARNWHESYLEAQQIAKRWYADYQSLEQLVADQRAAYEEESSTRSIGRLRGDSPTVAPCSRGMARARWLSQFR